MIPAPSDHPSCDWVQNMLSLEKHKSWLLFKQFYLTDASTNMMNIFKKQTPTEKLQKKRKLMEEAHKLSTTNRSASDAKHAEAEEIMKQIEALGHS